jgi:hypothetical protein
LRQYRWIDDWVKETSGDGFVDDYARTSPTEDFADTFSEFFLNPDRAQGVAAKKVAFIRDRLADMRREEKTAMANLYSFDDELFKIGAPMGFLSRLSKMPRGLKIGLGGGAAAGLYTHGKGKGLKEGRIEGTKYTRVVAERAYKMGVVRGAKAMHQHILQRMRRLSGSQG